MGKEVIISELEYYKCLDSIVRALHKSKGVEISELLDKNHSEFLYSKLGIRVSCFMVWDSFDSKYVLYQNDLIDSLGDFYPQIPFKVNNGDYEHIIDLAFIGNRYPEYKSEMNPYPEFHRFFQNSQAEILDKEEKEARGREQKTMHEYWDLENTLESDVLPFDVFYRPTGEVIFFLYAWRYLAKYFLKFGNNKRINSFEDFNYTEFEMNFELGKDWFKKTTGFNFSKLFDDFETKSKEKHQFGNKKEKGRITNAFKKALSAFTQYKEYEFQKGSFNFISREWVSLGINPENNEGHSLRSLLEYAKTVSNKIEENAQIREARETISAAINLIIGNNLTAINKDKIHSSLICIFYNLFNINGHTIKEVFERKFLPTIRFPVFPYFLEYLFDKSHSPKEHLVFPIWYSNEINKENDLSNQSRFVAYVLLSMEPVWSFTNRFDSYMESDLQEQNIHRIKAFYRVINKSLIEKGFYIKIIQKQLLIPSTKSAISAVMSRNMSHNIGSHVIPYLINHQNDFNSVQIEIYNRYIQERMELIATIGTTYPNYLKTEITVGELIIEFTGNSIVLKGIVDGSIHNLDFNDEYAKRAFHLPGGQIGRQVFYSLLEGIIRNCKKHSNPKIVNGAKQIELKFKIQECKDPIFKEDYYELHIIDQLGETNTRDKSTLNDIREYLFKPILENGELRKGGWGILELKIAASILIEFPLQSIDSYTNGILPVTIENKHYPPVLQVGFYDENLNIVADSGNDGQNLGYRLFIKKPKLIYTTIESLFTDLTGSGYKEITSFTNTFKEDETCDFYIGEINNSNLSNYRVIPTSQSESIISGSATKKDILFSIWAEYIKDNYRTISDYEIIFATFGKPITNLKNKIIFDSHGDWLKREYKGHLTDFKPAFYQIFNGKSSFGKLSELFHTDLLLPNKLRESAGVGISIFDERIQNETNNKNHEDLQIKASGLTLNQEITGDYSKLTLNKLFSLSGIFITDINSYSLQDFIDNKGNDLKEYLEFDSHPIITQLADSFKFSQFVLIHHTILELISFNLFKSKKQSDINSLYKMIYKKLKLGNSHLIIISGLGLPSNLPNNCFFLNLVTVQNILLVMKSKYHLVQVLKSLRPINNYIK